MQRKREILGRKDNTERDTVKIQQILENDGYTWHHE